MLCCILYIFTYFLTFFVSVVLVNPCFYHGLGPYNVFTHCPGNIIFLPWQDARCVNNISDNVVRDNA